MSDIVSKIREGAQVRGTFLKLPAPAVVELLALSALDFLVIDAEHAPLSLNDIEVLLLAGRACGLPMFIRVLDHSPKFIQQVLDMGAAGLVVPQVESAEQAEAIVRATQFIGGCRGFSSSTRSAGFGVEPMDRILRGFRRPLIICQIENRAGAQNAADIARVEGVDVVFIGRADLAVALGETSTKSALVVETVAQVFQAVKATGKPLGAMVGAIAEAENFRNMGASLLIQGSDQTLLIQAAREAFGKKGNP